MDKIVFQAPARIVNGPGSFAELAGEVTRLGASRVLLVTSPSFVRSGVAAETVARLEAAGVSATVFDAIEPDPRCETAEEAGRQARTFKADTVVAVGGGSVLDVAKLAAVLAVADTENVRDLVGVDKVTRPGLRTILVPTTAGTGSEVTNVAILSDDEAHLKVGVVSSYLIAHTVLLDAELTLRLPPAGTAASGLDALIHAVEAYTSVVATPHSDLYAEAAIRLIARHLRPAWCRGDQLQARQAMLTGALYGGLAFSNSGCAAVHAFAYPIGAEFHIPHGIANALMLMPVLRMNVPSNLERYADIARFMGENIEGLSAGEAALKAVAALETLLVDLRVPRHLTEYGVCLEHVPALARAVMRVTRLLGNNSYRITEEDAVLIYTQAL